MLFLVICLAHAGDVLLNQKPLAWPLMTSVPGLIVVVSCCCPCSLPGPAWFSQGNATHWPRTFVRDEKGAWDASLLFL